MISRRNFLRGASAAALAAAAPKIVRPALASSGCIAGAIRWDAWYQSTGGGYSQFTPVEPFVEASLGPAYWQFRAPSCAEVTGLNTISIGQLCNRQSQIDLEIQAAHAAGLKYWAYDWYPNADGTPDSSGFGNAWKLHQSSSYKNLMNWCITLGMPASVAAFEAMNAQFVTYMQQSNYQKVLNGRPVFYWLVGAVDSTWAAAITDLRTKAIAAGLATPYVVVLSGQNSGRTAATLALDVGADAISGYGIFDNGAFADLTTYAQNQWNCAGNGLNGLGQPSSGCTPSASSSGLTYVPNCMTGSDTRPRSEVPTVHQGLAPWINNAYYVTAGLDSEIVAQIQDAITFVNANPSVCSSTLILIYSWDENDEGGSALNGTKGDPPSANPPYMNGLETQLSAILP
jgi:TAT (twin-arginine translocation) pathway signal sequence